MSQIKYRQIFSLKSARILWHIKDKVNPAALSSINPHDFFNADKQPCLVKSVGINILQRKQEKPMAMWLCV